MKLTTVFDDIISLHDNFDQSFDLKTLHCKLAKTDMQSINVNSFRNFLQTLCPNLFHVFGVDITFYLS